MILTTFRCSNADPNFGAAWFYCREHPSSIPWSVLRSAADIIKHDLVAASQTYMRAISKYVLDKLSTLTQRRNDSWEIQWRKYFSVKINFIDSNDGILSGVDFLTAFRSMNRMDSMDRMIYEDKCKTPFPEDPILS